MRVALVVTFTGRDRPGIVESIARSVAAHGGNWEEGRMANLAGRFAGLLLATVEAERAESLERELEALPELAVTVERGGEPRPAPERGNLRLEITGTDRQGIVRSVSRVLAASGLNIEELSTERRAAPMSGAALFAATATLQCPPSVDLDELRRALEALADDLMVDIQLGPA